MIRWAAWYMAAAQLCRRAGTAAQPPIILGREGIHARRVPRAALSPQSLQQAVLAGGAGSHSWYQAWTCSAPPTPTQVDVALSNSFGFGGHNSCILFKRHQG